MLKNTAVVAVEGGGICSTWGGQKEWWYTRNTRALGCLRHESWGWTDEDHHPFARSVFGWLPVRSESRTWTSVWESWSTAVLPHCCIAHTRLLQKSTAAAAASNLATAVGLVEINWSDTDRLVRTPLLDIVVDRAPKTRWSLRSRRPKLRTQPPTNLLRNHNQDEKWHATAVPRTNCTAVAGRPHRLHQHVEH